MPVSVVVGGQYGSEGKGKVALELVRHDSTITIAVRPGGTNSGHTGYSRDGHRIVLRQLPAAAIDGNVKVVLPAGSYIDVDLLHREMRQIGLRPDQLAIDPQAHIIRSDHVAWENAARLADTIGSTGSGTGAAVLSRVGRFAPGIPQGTPASEAPALASYIQDTAELLSSASAAGERVLIEGTQGFGLSVLHGGAWPKVTSRDTTAASFLSEAGLSPIHVDEIVLVLRCHPIRVAGDSGPLAGETDWATIASSAGAPITLEEFTSVTKKLRRVGQFDSAVVRKAIAVNCPTKIVLNHVDYVDWGCRAGKLTDPARNFVHAIEREIGRHVDMVGTSETILLQADREILV